MSGSLRCAAIHRYLESPRPENLKYLIFDRGYCIFGVPINSLRERDVIIGSVEVEVKVSGVIVRGVVNTTILLLILHLTLCLMCECVSVCVCGGGPGGGGGGGGEVG